MSKKERIVRLRKALQMIATYPREGNSRRGDEGYPLEIVYDEFAYKRMVDSYRDAARAALSEDDAPNVHGGLMGVILVS